MMGNGGLRETTVFVSAGARARIGELDRFVLAKIASARYENASEVVRDALRALERRERE